MQNISGYGLSVNIIASVSFPVGLFLTQWADDANPFEVPAMQIADKAMGLNGDLIIWTKANPLIVTLNAIPGSFTDLNLAVLFEANRAGRGKTSTRDVINMVGIYGNNTPVVLTNGAITDGIPFNGVSSAGRLITKSYSFCFENKVAGL